MNLKDIESLSDADKLALVKSIQERVAANKAKQVSLEAGQYAKLVVDAVKKIKTDLEARYAEISQDIAAKSASIKDGKDGLQGPKGEKGDRGFDGVNGKDGRDGKDGKDGADGSDGVGVSDAHIDFDGALVITLTNGREINAGEVVPFDVAEKIKVIGNGGGTSQYVLDAIADLQTQISAISGGLSYRGTWNASTNTPTLTSSSGTTNYYYVVSVAGSTNLNGVTDWQVGDWAIYNGSAWQKIDQSNSVTSVNGQQGAVVLSTTDVAEGTNQYFTNARARGAVSAGTGISYNSTTGVIASTITQYTDANARAALSAGTGISYNSSTGSITNSSPDQTVVLTAGTGISTSGTYPNFTITNSAPDQTVSLTGSGTTTVTGTYPNFTISSADSRVGTVTSVGGTGTVNGLTLTGTVTSSGNLTLGGTLDLSSPPAIGGTTPSTGNFTTLRVGSSSILGNANADVTLGLAVRNSGASMGYLQTYNSNAGADLKTWRFGGNGSGSLVFETVNDAYSSSTNRMTLDSSGNLTANSFNTANFTVIQSGTKLLFRYNGTTIASMDSTGIITSATNIVSNGTP